MNKYEFNAPKFFMDFSVIFVLTKTII